MTEFIPDDVLALIFARCSARTIARLECVCTQFRRVGRRVPVQLHITPCNAHVVRHWARGRCVTKLTTRRIVVDFDFEALRVLDHMYAPVYSLRVQTLSAMTALQRLRIHHLHSPLNRNAVFKTSSLPPALVDVDITFGTSWGRVDIDGTGSIVILALQTFPPKPWENRQPDVLVTHIGSSVRDLTISTSGGITVVPHDATRVRNARIECEDNLYPTSILRLFGSALEQLVLSMPRASLVWSQDFPAIDPRVIAIEVDFAAIDVLGPSLKELELRVDRLAYIPIPERVVLNACIRGTVITHLN